MYIISLILINYFLKEVLILKIITLIVCVFFSLCVDILAFSHLGVIFDSTI